MKKRIYALATFLFLVLALSAAVSCTGSAETLSSAEGDRQVPPDSDSSGFIRLWNGRLWEGENEFRFLSVNIPNYHIVEDSAGGLTPAWHRVSAFEQHDAAEAVRRLGGRVFRIYTFSVEGGKNNTSGLSHIFRDADGKIAYNEELFKDLDRGIAIAAEAGLRLIIPLVDNWQWFGGYAEWGKLAGGNFWKDPAVVSEYKAFVRWLLERKNTATGIRYRDDPAILCWELGNELERAPYEWISDMAAYIKSIDGNHLVMDGGHKRVDDRHLCDPNIDIVTMHYGNDLASWYAGQAADAGKAFIYGEFRFNTIFIINRVCKSIIDSPAAGAMLWSLRFRTSKGGFYFHNDFSVSDSIQYPGFDETKPANERAMVEQYRSYAFQIRGLEVPSEEIPASPLLLYVSSNGEMSWRGSAGAWYYRIEKAQSPDGPWQTAAAEASDAVNTGGKNGPLARLPLYSDPDCTGDEWYRIIALNGSGESVPGNALMAGTENPIQK